MPFFRRPFGYRRRSFHHQFPGRFRFQQQERWPYSQSSRRGSRFRYYQNDNTFHNPQRTKVWRRKDNSGENSRYVDSTSLRSEVSIFVENIPKQAAWRWVWKIFKIYGEVLRVYIPFSRSVNGLRYAFVYFRRNEDAWKAIQSTNHKVFAGHQFSVEFARSNKIQSNNVVGRSSDPVKPYHQAKNLNTQSRSCEVFMDKNKLEILKSCLVGRSKFPVSLERLHQELADEGRKGIHLVRISSDEYIIGFKYVAAKLDMEIEGWAGLKKWFQTIIPWEPISTPSRRSSMVRVSGLPIVFWNQENFARILEPWGKVMLFLSDVQTPVDSRWCLISIETNQFQTIEESLEIRFEEMKMVININEVSYLSFEDAKVSLSYSEDSTDGDVGGGVGGSSPVFMVENQEDVVDSFSAEAVENGHVAGIRSSGEDNINEGCDDRTSGEAKSNESLNVSPLNSVAA